MLVSEGAARPEFTGRGEPARGGPACAVARRAPAWSSTSARWPGPSFLDLAEQVRRAGDEVGERLTGLSRVGARTAIALALRNGKRLTTAWLSGIKKDLIERECQGLLEFIESPFTLDHIAGLEP